MTLQTFAASLLNLKAKLHRVPTRKERAFFLPTIAPLHVVVAFISTAYNLFFNLFSHSPSTELQTFVCLLFRNSRVNRISQSVVTVH